MVAVLDTKGRRMNGEAQLNIKHVTKYMKQDV